jgi:hypothetical protein
MIGGGLIFIIYGISLGERGNFFTETINIRNYQPVESILLPNNGSLYEGFLKMLIHMSKKLCKTNKHSESHTNQRTFRNQILQKKYHLL